MTLSGAFYVKVGADTSKSYSTNVGITFRGNENTDSNSKHNNSTENTPSVNNSGLLPKTGERPQSLILVGIIFLILLIIILRKKKEEKN